MEAVHWYHEPILTFFVGLFGTAGMMVGFILIIFWAINKIR